MRTSPRLAALVALAASTAALAQVKPPKPFTQGATVEGITEYSLPNGLKVLLFPDPAQSTVTVNVTYFVGSRHEDYGETGMAHLLEHLVFKGTPKTPNVPQALVDHGAEPNGTTWFDRTNYFETLPATDANLEWALRFEADRMVNSFIAKKDLDSEMTVVRNEFESGENDPHGVLMDRTMATAFLWHNYGQTTIGARSDIENVPIDRLQAFYRKHYQPDNALLVVAGKFDEQKALKLIADSFGKLKKPNRTLFSTYTREPAQDGERAVTVRRVGSLQVLAAAYHVPSGTHADFPAVDVLSKLMGEAPSGRLHKALVESKKAAKVHEFAFQLREPGVMLFMADVRQNDSLDAARAAFLQTLEEAGKTPFTAGEVERAKTSLLKDIELTLNSSERVGKQLSEWAAMGDWRMLYIHRDRLKKVTPADVQRVATTYLQASNRTLGSFVPTDKPDRAEVPESPDVVALVKDYKGDQALSMGERFDPSPKNVEARVKRSQLPSGLKLALLPKKTRGSTVALSMNLRFGDEPSLMGRRLAGEVLPKMLSRGTKKRTRQQFKDEVDKLMARLSIGGTPTQVNVNVEVRRAQLVPLLQLVAEALREPALDPKELEELRTELLAYLEAQKTDPMALASVAMRRAVDPWPKDHPFYVAEIDEQIALVKALKLEQLKDFHARFYGASTGELSVVGDFEPAELTKVAGELFGSWKSPTKFARVARPYKPTKPQAITLDTPDKANSVFFAGSMVEMRDDDPDYPAMALADFMIGGGFLNSRLATRLRQKEGLSYGAGSYFQSSPVDKSSVFMAYAISAPANTAKVETGFREEIERALAKGFFPDEVSKAKAGMLQYREQERANDRELAQMLALQLFVDRTMTYEEGIDQRLQSLKPTDINEALRKYLDPGKLVQVKAGDFRKEPAPKTGAANPGSGGSGTR